MEKERLIIIDANAIIHRAFHAIPKLTTKKGELVNAVYGFLLFFLKAIKEFSPTYIVAAFDYPAPTFRKEKYELYKANREKASDELYLQIPKIKKILEEFEVKVLEKKGFEADDIIGTVSKKSSEEGIDTVILTGDLDALQLVNDKTKVYILRRGIKDAVLYDTKEVVQKYQGLMPNQLVDFKSLRGDPSDNIPGVFGVGEKTAIGIIKKFGSLENLYKEIEGDTETAKKLKSSLKEKLVKHKEKAFLSKMLAKICEEAPIDFDLKNCQWKGYNEEKTFKELESYDFYSLIERIKNGDKPIAAKQKKKENNNLTLL